MGEILSVRKDKEKILFKIKVSVEELSQLKSNLKRVHLFQGASFNGKAKVVERGIGGGAKYFEMPLVLRSRKKSRFSDISYQKIPIGDKIYYIFVGDNYFEKKLVKTNDFL